MKRGEAPAAQALVLAVAARVQRFDACRAPRSADDLHDLRVASRRLRAALQLAGSLDPTGDLRRVRRKLRGIGRRLGEIREADVTIELLGGLRRAHPDALGLAAEVALAAERARREQTSVPAAKKLKIGSLSSSFAEIGGGGVTLAAFAREVLPPDVRQLATLAAVAADHPTAFRLHRTRIAAKKLRYAIELMTAAFLPGRARRILATLRDVQGRLGSEHDWFVLHRRLSELRRQFRVAGLVRLDAALLPLMKAAGREQASASAAAVRRIRGLVARNFFSRIEADLAIRAQ